SYINRFGADCMAGWTSYNKIDSFALLPITTISLAVTTFVGQNLGAGDYARAKKGTRTALLLSEAVTVVVLLPLMLLSPQLISLFNQEPEVLRYGTLFIRFISPFYLVICINQIISGSLRGAGDSRSCMLIMLGSFVLFRQIYLMIVYRVWGTVLPVAMGYPAGWVLCSVILLLYYRSGAWKKASVFKKKAE
ncbi:MAG: MATE family efflux transporter, partial [Oscillospiraceae bacterium]